MTSQQATPATEPRVEMSCPQCGRRLRRRGRDAGRMIRCPSCGAWIAVPTPRRPRASEVLVITHADLADLPAAAARRRISRQRRKSRRPNPRHARLRARHVGKKCPYCLSPIKPQAEMVVCPECGIPHHPECWEENGGCTTWGCTAAPQRAPRPAAVRVATRAAATTDVHILGRTYRTIRPARSQAAGCAIGLLQVVGVTAVFVVGAYLVTSARSPMWIFALVIAVAALMRLFAGLWRVQE